MRFGLRQGMRTSIRRAPFVPDQVVQDPWTEEFVGPNLQTGSPSSGLWYDVTPPPVINGTWLVQFVAAQTSPYDCRRRFPDTNEMTVMFRLRHTAGTPKGYHYLYFISDQDTDYAPPAIGGADNITYIDISPTATLQVYGRDSDNWGYPSDRFGTDTSLNDGSYHNLIFYFRLNDVGSSNGIVQSWVDGVQDIDLSNILFRTTGWLWRHVLLGIDLNFGSDTMDVETDSLSIYASDQRPSTGVNYFSWNCESTTTSVGTGTFVGNASLTTTEKHSGTRSMQLPIRGDDQGNVGLDGVGWNISDFFDGGWLYYRWWIKFSNDYSWGSSTAWMKAQRTKQSSGNPPPQITGIFRDDGVWIHECPNCDPSDTTANTRVTYNFNPQSNTMLKSWTEVIVGFKKQTSPSAKDGEFHLWVNGTYQGTTASPSVHRWTNLNVAYTEAWGGWMVRPFPQLNGLPTDGGTIWIDDVSVDSDWNSTQYAKP